jgi:flagellar biosynthetic protein FliR
MDLGTWLDLASGRLATGLLIFARFAGVLFSAPLVSAKSVPPQIRVGLSGMLALILTPLVRPVMPDSAALMIVGLLKEIVLGLLLGWVATLFFATAQMVGEWLDLQAGFHASQLLNPASETHSGPLGNFYHLLAGILFLGVGGHAMVIRAAALSLRVSPPGALSFHVGASGDWASLAAQMIWIAVQLAAPVAAVLFLAEVTIGLLSRAMPQVNMMMLTLPAKSSMALGALALSIPLIGQALMTIFHRMGGTLEGLVRGLRLGG